MKKIPNYIRKQLPLPGLESAKQLGIEDFFRPLAQCIAALQERLIKMEREISILKARLNNQDPPDFAPDCYFWSDDRCLGRPADTCRWAVKISDAEWICACPCGEGANL